MGEEDREKTKKNQDAKKKHCCNLIKEFGNRITSLVNTDFISIFASVSISVILEIFRKFLLIHDNVDTKSFFEILSKFNIDVLNNILNIILLTLIIWGITGLSRILKEAIHKKRKEVVTVFTLCFYILCNLWYLINFLFEVDWFIVTITATLDFLLFLILAVYLTNVTKSFYNSDYRVG